MKTPEEIKKGMSCCLTRWNGDYLASCSDDCPYRNEGIWCRNVLMADITALNKQLESRLAQVERERDAAVHDLKLVRCCGTCINNEGGCTTECYIVSGAPTGWQWRGVCPENTKVKHIPENCHNYTIRAYDGMGCCLGTKEIDPCKGENCENWKQKEE